MPRSIRDLDIATPMPLGDFNPLPPGGQITVYANASAVGQTLTIMAGGIRVANCELGVEPAAGVGPLVPDHLVASWRNNGSAPLDIDIRSSGATSDVLIFIE